MADLAAGEWPELARHAAIVLTAERDQGADVSDRIRLLADCRTVFGDADALPSTTLVTRLRSDPEAPWCEPPPGITPKRPAALLAEYDIRSTPIRFGESTGQARGYYRADFTDARARYCPTPPGNVSQPSQSSPPRSGPGRIKACDTSIRHTKTPVTGLNWENELVTDVTDVTDTPRFGVINGGGAG